MFDILQFANDRKEIVVPSFIKIIDANAFSKCYSLKKLVFLKDSKLKNIKKNAFYNSFIECISIPKHVKKSRNQLLFILKLNLFILKMIVN